jgi:hypothetical protein
MLGAIELTIIMSSLRAWSEEVCEYWTILAQDDSRSHYQALLSNLGDLTILYFTKMDIHQLMLPSALSSTVNE